MIVISPAQSRQIIEAAEAAYPEECCGLVVGRVRGNGDIEVTRVAPSRNVASDDAGAPRRRDRFEVDPELRFALMRETDGTDLAIVGHYHSHPDHPPGPSAHDLASCFEPELVWLIVAVEKGRAGAITAHRLDEKAGQFRAIPLKTRGSGTGP